MLDWLMFWYGAWLLISGCLVMQCIVLPYYRVRFQGSTSASVRILLQRAVLPKAYRYLDTLIPQAQRVRVRAVWGRTGSPARLASHTQLRRKRSSTLNSSAATTTTTDDLPRRQGTLYCWTPYHWKERILFLDVAIVKRIRGRLMVLLGRGKKKKKEKQDEIKN